MPALNIIAIQLTVWKSGFSPSWPSGIRPYLLKANQNANSTKQVAEMMKSHPRLVTTQFRIVVIVPLKPVGVARPQARIAATITAVTPKTTLSVTGLREHNGTSSSSSCWSGEWWSSGIGTPGPGNVSWSFARSSASRGPCWCVVKEYS